MLTKTLKFIRYELLYSGHIQALGAAGIVYATAVIAGLKITVGMFVVPYLLFQSIYYFDRYWGLRTDVATNEQRTLHLRQFGLLLPILVIFLLLVTMFLLFLFATDMAVFLAGTIAIFGFLYPIFFKNITKYVPLFKNYYVAFVFASLVFFPFIYRGAIEKIGVSEAVFDVGFDRRKV